MRFLTSSCRMRTSSCRFFSIISSSSASIALARSSFSMPFREKIFTPTMMPSMPGGHSERRIANVACLLAKDGPQQLFLRRKLGLALRRHLAHENVAGRDVGADADDAALVEILQEALGHVRNVARDLLRDRASCRAPRSRTPRCGSTCSSRPSPSVLETRIASSKL